MLSLLAPLFVRITSLCPRASPFTRDTIVEILQRFQDETSPIFKQLTANLPKQVVLTKHQKSSISPPPAWFTSLDYNRRTSSLVMVSGYVEEEQERRRESTHRQPLYSAVEVLCVTLIWKLHILPSRRFYTSDSRVPESVNGFMVRSGEVGAVRAHNHEANNLSSGGRVGSGRVGSATSF